MLRLEYGIPCVRYAKHAPFEHVESSLRHQRVDAEQFIGCYQILVKSSLRCAQAAARNRLG